MHRRLEQRFLQAWDQLVRAWVWEGRRARTRPHCASCWLVFSPLRPHQLPGDKMCAAGSSSVLLLRAHPPIHFCFVHTHACLFRCRRCQWPRPGPWSDISVRAGCAFKWPRHSCVMANVVVFPGFYRQRPSMWRGTRRVGDPLALAVFYHHDHHSAYSVASSALASASGNA